jgi:hypothetical protein
MTTKKTNKTMVFLIIDSAPGKTDQIPFPKKPLLFVSLIFNFSATFVMI